MQTTLVSRRTEAGMRGFLGSIPALLCVSLWLALSSVCSAEVVDTDDYRINPRDLIQFQIYEEPDTLMVQRVSAKGELPLPMIGVVSVSGLSLREAEAKLRDLYIEGEFFVDPQVILVLEQYSEQTVSVLGQVNKPMRIVFPVEASRLNIVQAITIAGGLTRLARADSVQVTRIGVNGLEKRTIVNVEAYLADKRRKAEPEEQFELLPGDIVFIPERTF
ncbi:polysaccharide biosynthesis/export family protein [Pelagicoccus mobilis]|uniref:Polysaccharide biosynthesis/export family protein n=1 Tax=Pelagicoccus mobilis TaxID=415221 RepID=A0A934RYP5_9BACT|nr:polysaccharide biosynthesis/export family protein [Pelagicoccus mobilis]MBK1877935.1 polysaccharide biosynthesis/export family protein [Pelagicoccus mobilis]